MNEAEKYKSIMNESKKIFFAQTKDSIKECISTLLKFRLDQSNNDHKAFLKRFFHTLKGSGNMLGYPKLAEIGMEYEELIDNIILKSEYTHKFFSSVLEGIARVNAIIEKEMTITQENRGFVETDSFIKSPPPYSNLLSNPLETEFKILAVDDDQAILNTVESCLKAENFNVLTCNRPKDVLAILKKQLINILILDINMPELNGLELYKQLKKNHIEVHVVFLTSEEDLHKKLDAFNTGAEDYIAKPFVPHEFVARIKRIAKSIHNHNVDVQIDKVTGAYTKVFLEKSFAGARDRILNAQENYSAAVLDINDFLSINKEYGHEFGNFLLKDLYIELKGSLRLKAEIFRISEDVFLILFPGENSEMVFKHLSEFKEKYMARRIHKDNDNFISISFNACITEIRSRKETAFTLLDLLKEGIRTSKEKGKGKILLLKPREESESDETKGKNKDTVRQPKILLVDDAFFQIFMLKSKLNIMGYEVIYSINGKDALFKTKVYKPDIILLDLVLPELDGVGVLEAIRGDSELKDIKIFILTGNARKEVISKCISLGVEGIIAKPFDVDSVCIKISKFLEV